MSELPVPHYTPANRPSILIVDDYDDARDVWTMLLGAEGFEVLTAANGVDALAVALRETPSIVVLDLSLPGMSGLEVARAIRDNQREQPTPLVALTGYSDPGHLDQAREAGFDLVLTKPCTPSVLIDEIRRLLGRR
jgi:CheY-like chemotaxis protein